MNEADSHFLVSIKTKLTKDFTELSESYTVEQALARIRENGAGDKIIYFYVVDANRKLKGVLPTRRLLISQPQQRLTDIMVPRVVAIPETATVLDACELFIMHRFMAIPVINTDQQILGVVYANILTDEINLEPEELGDRQKNDAIFESIGLHLSDLKGQSAFKAFRHRFPWLLSTIAGGLIAAVLGKQFELTLSTNILLVFFISLVMGLGESVCAQSVTIAVQAFNSGDTSSKRMRALLSRELRTALLLGIGCGVLVYLFISGWQGFTFAGGVIGLSIFLSLIAACLIGVAVTGLLHWVKLDPKIAAGPVALAITDIVTLLFYYGLAYLILSHHH